MGCDFCEVSTTTALYVQCVRHKACNDCFKQEQQRRSAGQPCFLCLREDMKGKLTKQKPKILKRHASMESVLDGTPKSKLSAKSASDDLNGLNEELERLLTVAPPAGTELLLMPPLPPYTGEPYTTEVPSGVCPPPCSTETSPRANNGNRDAKKKNVTFCPYPKHKAKRPRTFITQHMTEEENDAYDEFYQREQDMSCGSNLKQEYNEKEEYLFGKGFSAVNENPEFTHDRLGNPKGKHGVHFKGLIIETEWADGNDQHMPLCPRPEWEEGVCESSSSSSEDQPEKVPPANREEILSEKGLSLEQRSMIGKVIQQVRSWKKSSCISISGDTDDEDLDLTDLEKKISVINLQEPHAHSRARPTVRRRNPCPSKSEQSLASLEEGLEHDGSDHLLYLGRHEPTGELAHYQQKGLLEEWARKQEAREKQQTKDATQTTFEKNADGDALKGNSNGDTSPIKGVPKQASPCSESAPVKTDIKKETLDARPPSGSNNYACVERDDSLKETLMAALRAAVREEDTERFGCEGLPDPEYFWI